MIYKFLCSHDSTIEKRFKETMEVEISEFDENLVRFCCSNDDVGFTEIFLNKDDVYKLIGALHLLHKEMKDE